MESLVWRVVYFAALCREYQVVQETCLRKALSYCHLSKLDQNAVNRLLETQHVYRELKWNYYQAAFQCIKTDVSDDILAQDKAKV